MSAWSAWLSVHSHTVVNTAVQAHQGLGKITKLWLTKLLPRSLEQKWKLLEFLLEKWQVDLVLSVVLFESVLSFEFSP